MVSRPSLRTMSTFISVRLFIQAELAVAPEEKAAAAQAALQKGYDVALTINSANTDALVRAASNHLQLESTFDL